MYHRQNINNDKSYQNVEFFSLKKKTSENVYAYQDNKLSAAIDKQDVSVVSILAFFHLTSGQAIDEQVFTGMNFELTPKQFQSFGHQKTMKILLKVLKVNSSSEQSLIQLINDYPLMNFVMQAYCRAACIKSAKQTLTDGQKEIIENFAVDLRGNLLDILANFLETHLTLTCGPITETYGQQKHQRKIQLKFTESKIQAELLHPKSTYTYIKQTQTNIKTSKLLNTVDTQASQSNQVSSIETNSLLKSNLSSTTELNKCQKCRMLKSRCYCSRKQVGSPYQTPNSASKHEKNFINNTIAANLPTIVGNVNVLQFKGRCTCHKMFCTCRR